MNLKLTNYRLEKLRQDYFSWMDSNNIVKKYGVSLLFLRNLEAKPSFRQYIIDGIKWKRCKTCDGWKIASENFWLNHWIGSSYKAHCRYCFNLMKRNKRILDPEQTAKETASKKRWRHNNQERYNKYRLDYYHKTKK